MAEHNGNGEKSRLWTILQMVILGLLAWGGLGIVQAKTDIAILQTNYVTINQSLIKMDAKLDRMLDHRR